jgi:hypothetical protein
MCYISSDDMYPRTEAVLCTLDCLMIINGTWVRHRTQDGPAVQRDPVCLSSRLAAFEIRCLLDSLSLNLFC